MLPRALGDFFRGLGKGGCGSGLKSEPRRRRCNRLCGGHPAIAPLHARCCDSRALQLPRLAYKRCIVSHAAGVSELDPQLLAKARKLALGVGTGAPGWLHSCWPSAWHTPLLLSV